MTMAMARRLVTALAGLVALAGSAVAEPFWVEYNASSGLFPEEVGWERLVMGGGAQRSLEDGLLTLDGLASSDIVDDYGMLRPIDLSPGQSFVMEWRLRVDEVHGSSNPLVGVWFDEGRGRVSLKYSESAIYSLLEGVWIDFEPYVFHEYSLVSSDMLTYTLHIDGSVAYSGNFVSPSY